VLSPGRAEGAARGAGELQRAGARGLGPPGRGCGAVDPCPVRQLVDDGPGGLDGALGRWAEGHAAGVGVGPIRPAPTIWCSRYHYFERVTEQDILENLDAIEELELPVDVVQAGGACG
jgi:hypothetical protein